MHRDKAVRHRSKERKKRGILTLDCLWKTKQDWFSGQLQHPKPSPWYHVGSHIQKKAKGKVYTKYNKAFFFLHFIHLTLHKSYTTSLLRRHSAVCSQLSGNDWKEVLENQFTRKPLAGPSATSVSSRSFPFRIKMADNNRPFATFTHTQPAVILRQAPEERHKDSWENRKRQKTKILTCVQAGMVFNPATSASKKEKEKKTRNQLKHI